MHSSTGILTSLSNRAAVPPALRKQSGYALAELIPPSAKKVDASELSANSSLGDGLLHDVRNLMGTLGLYCDLLSMPGVLQAEHRGYAEDLRLVGTRSGALISRLMDYVAKSETRAQHILPAVVPPGKRTWLASTGFPARLNVDRRGKAREAASLRRIVERCSGLLSRIAAERPVRVHYGEASAAPLDVAEEAVERILVNLVANAADAIEKRSARLASGVHLESRAGSEAAPAQFSGTIHVRVGMLMNRVGDPKPWPFRRVRLTVEDDGCGIPPDQLERLLCGSRAPERGSHGLGFLVVRELVASSHGDLRVMSTPGVGTCVQIEWPVAVSGLAKEGWAQC